MKHWNTKTIGCRVLSLVMTFAMTITLFSGCGPAVSKKVQLKEPATLRYSAQEATTQTYSTSATSEVETTEAELLVTRGNTALTEEMQKKATELGTPLAVYNYLKESIVTEDYTGSVKGAKGTYTSLSGNDVDQASLLIAMLRYLGYEAKYVKGYAHIQEGASTEHVWVRTLVPYTRYRGAGNNSGKMVWLDLDTSVKAYENGVIKTENLSYLPLSLQYEVEQEIATFSQIARPDENPSVVAILSPENGETLTEPVDIVGSVDDADGLDSWRLEYRQAGAMEYQLLAEGTEAKEEDVLGNFDTTMLMNGSYEMRLTVVDQGGNEATLTHNYVVEGTLKVGAMHIGFTDVTAKMGGTTVSVNRVYDSRNKRQGDFGYGWSLGMQGMELSESGSLAEGYEMVQSGSGLSTAYQMIETQSHDVVVTYGDGTSDRFELTFNPEKKALVPISEVELGYRCVTNQKVKLEILADTSAYVSGNELMFYNESMYDMLQYKLTTEEGNEIYLNREEGVYKIVDSVGNVITVDENGYHSEDGKSITFTRDEEGRIVKTEDPTGKTITYEYDKAGDLVSVTDEADRTVTFTYDKQHNLASITDPSGVAVARNEYDENGRLVATIDADGNRVEYDYDIEGRTQVVKDRRGNTTVYTYDDNGNILRTVDAYGNKTDNTYDAYNNLLSTTDAKGNVTSYSYDENGNVTEVTAADGTKVESTYTEEHYVSGIQMMDKTVMAMEYDDKGRLSSVEDANGNVTEYAYTSDGKLTGLNDAIGTYQKVTYDDKGNVATTTNGAGESASYTYDEDGRCTSVTISREENGETVTFTSHYSYNVAGDITQSIDNAGNITKYEYDANGNQTASTDAKGRRIVYTYDDLGNMTKVTYPDGTFETFTYDANGNNVTATDRNGLTVTMVYDKLDRMTEKKYADGTKETYAYDEVGNVTEQVSTSGAKTTYAYDNRNRNTSITDAFGNVTTFEYDEAARLTKRIDALGNEISYAYDDNGNIIKTTYADGNSVTSEYDARNRVTRQEDQYGNETTYEYDGADRLTKVTDAYGNSYSYGYDGNGNLVTVTDANGHVTRYTYDDVGRVATVTNALGKTMAYSYDKTGNIVEFTDYAGTVTTYSYDDMDRLTEKKIGTEQTIYSYDDKGQLTQVTDKSGNISYGYDKYGRLTSQTDARGITVFYTYDDVGRLETFDNGFGTTTYEYDVLDRVTRVIDRKGKATVYEYDALGNRSVVRYPNGNVVTYTYDACQRLKEEWIVNETGVTLAKYTYGLGKAGERTSVTELVNGVETEITYKYDKLNRLIKETIERKDSSITNAYEYDAVSNRISKETTVQGDVSVLADVDNEEIKVTEGTTTYTYNALNQLVTETSEEGIITYTFDDNGNLIKQTGDKTVDYSYDKENRLLRATIQKDNSVIIESYTYDYAGNRTSKTINETDTTYYVNETSNSLTMVVAETDQDGKETAYYTRGEELLSMESGNEICYYLYDGHGSVRTLTNEAGRVTDRYSYDAYGNLLEKEGDSKNEFLYTGEQYNANTGLYYLRARYMNPSTGTFISMDSYQGSIYDPVTLHKYLYANANPVMYTDPSGYKVESLVATIGNTILAVAYCWQESVMFRIGMTLLLTLTFTVAQTMVSNNRIYTVENAIESGDILYRIDSVVSDVKSEVLAKIKDERDEKGNYTVYTLIDSQGKVRYVGRTKNYNKRMEAHAKPGGKMHDYNLSPGIYYTDLTWNEARGLEQTLMYCYHTLNGTVGDHVLGVNYINGVSQKNDNKNDYHKATKDYINRYPSYFENQIDNEINNVKEKIDFWWK